MANPNGPPTSSYVDVDIVNMALLRLGQNPINAFGAVSGAATIVKGTYNHERDALLRRIPWSFARKWVPITQLSVAPPNLEVTQNADSHGAINFTAAYALPNDFLRMYRFSPYDAHWRLIGSSIYTDAVPANAFAGVLLGEQPPNGDGAANQPASFTSVGVGAIIGIEYIAQITDPNLWDTLFRDTFVARLAWMLSMGITGLAEVGQENSQEYKAAIADAAAVNGMENWPDTWADNIVQSVRWGYSGIGLDF